jgi:hypothetical protein
MRKEEKGMKRISKAYRKFRTVLKSKYSDYWVLRRT